MDIEYGPIIIQNGSYSLFLEANVMVVGGLFVPIVEVLVRDVGIQQKGEPQVRAGNVGVPDFFVLLQICRRH